ncbi:DNA gyrase subunit A [Parachryseolinea silvisoli]|uniref:DNA gyrase subunit A n=1 Tax=Parachryseolinea silvisoli TaxID=2873601 RepID=UPI0022658730|nr:DNA gyrase subunit A [Parachryseolinea silvisoli]MCD9018285.1 DNA gyrase subunit A [Parachryseolinea silvisoli]
MAEETSGLVPGRQSIIPINIEDEMRGAYIDYSMSVIISRALPDVRDGLKPVHRRVLFGMLELGVNYNKPHKKSARIVGEVLGKYHPHGDASVYDTMVRMAQDWSLRYMLVDGQGNFGSIDGDSPAAMRYTEARLRRIAEEMLMDINKDTVDFQPNFDDSLKEPSVLPGKIPNLLLNGSSGIAVGMATNMAPHNLREVVDGIHAYIDNRDITIPELMKFVTAPDFPTGALIYGYAGVQEAFLTGRGRVVMRAKAEIVTSASGKDQIVVTEIPYMVNKAMMIEKTAALINEKKIEGISDLRDESDREGYRIVYDLKRDAVPNVVLNNLFKYTQLQSTFGINNVALVKGRPMTLNLKDMIHHYVEHRHEVIIRRTKFELAEAERRAHILEGYLIALDHLDEVISLIRNSKDPEAAKEGLIQRFGLSEIQAKAILDMRLQRLTGLERDKIQDEYKEVKALIDRLNAILADEGLRMQIVKDELTELRERYGDARRTEVIHSDDDISIEDMIPNEEMVITISNQGYIKRTLLSEYRTQGRGGVGSKGVSTKEDDFTEHLFIAHAHNYLLIFTDQGKVYWKKAYEIPEGNKISKGRAIQNLINIESGDTVRAIIKVKSLTDDAYINNNYVILCTENGIIKKTSLEAYSRPRQGGINAITIHEGDRLLNASLTNGSNHIIIAKSEGKAVHFNEADVRPMGRMAAGVRGVTLEGDTDKVIGMVCITRDDANLLVVSEHGYGKRSSIDDYRITRRGGLGVKTLNITEKTGKIVAIKEVVDDDELMIINRSGITIRIAVSELRIMGRATQGVRLIKLNDDDRISSVEKIQQIVVDKNSGDENSGDGSEIAPENPDSLPPADETPDENLS